jgi:hypothetical protein
VAAKAAEVQHRPVEGSGPLRHSLVPLDLAVLLVRDGVYGESGQGPWALSFDADTVATFIASTVPVYAYSDDPSVRPRILKRSQRTGWLKSGERLGIQANDVMSVIAMLEQPERAVEIRGKAVLKEARRLGAECQRLRQRFLALQREFRRLRDCLQRERPFKRTLMDMA